MATRAMTINELVAELELFANEIQMRSYDYKGKKGKEIAAKIKQSQDMLTIAQDRLRAM